MSVYKNSIYRDNALQWLLRNIKVKDFEGQYCKSLANFDIEDFGNFEVPRNLQKGNLERQLNNTIQETRVNIKDLIPTRKVKEDVALRNLVKILPRSKIGLGAVYHFVGRYWKQIFDPSKIQHHRHQGESDLHRNLFTLGLTAAHHTARDIAARSKEVVQQYRDSFEQGLFFIRELWSIRASAQSRKNRKALKEAKALDKYPIPMDPRTRKILKDEHVWVFKGTIIIVPKHNLYCYTITQDDLDRIEKLIKGFANATIYPFQAFNYKEEEVREFSNAIQNYQELCRIAFLKSDYKSAQKMCRALDVIFHIEFARISGDVSKMAYNLQVDKYYKEGLDQIIDHNSVLAVVSHLPMNVRLEVLAQYKALPQPDFDYFGAMERQRNLYEEMQARNRRLFDQRTFNQVMLYHKWLMIISFYKAHGYCPGNISPTAEFKSWHPLYKQSKPDRINFREVDDIYFGGEFSWVQRTTDVIDLIKDKAICPKQVNDLNNGFQVRDVPIEEKNQLMDWITRSEMPNLQDLQATMDADRYDVRAEDKPEAKKPHGRWFFEAGTDARLIQSNYEESVAFYCKQFPGSCNGISVSDKLEKMRRITADRTSTATLRHLFVSFDIDKFSPSLQLEIHEALDKQWADAFGKPHLVGSSVIFSAGNIHYLKGSIHHVMPKMGADFEGFAGRKLTCYHCAVMGYCVRIMKERGMIHGVSGFACLIDDGLLRVSVSAENYEFRCLQITDFIDQLYAKCSLIISWDKTYTSEFTSIFLNDVRYHGRAIPIGLKAVMKITSKADSIVPNLLDELQMAESTSRGAIVAGAPLVLVYSLYSWYVTDLIRKWGRKDYSEGFKNTMPVLAFFPVSYGGLGMATGLHLQGSLTAGGVEDQLSALFVMGSIFPDLKAYINQRLTVQLNVKTVTQIVEDPDSIKTNVRSLRNTRVHRVITRHLPNVVRSPLLSAMLNFVQGQETTFAGQAFEAGNVFPSELLDSLRRMEPAYAVEQFVLKFTKSTTASRICPKYALRTCGFANVTEAQEVCKEFYQLPRVVTRLVR